MLYFYDLFLREPLFWIVPWIFMSLAYLPVFGKMGLPKGFCINPVLAEWRLSRVLFKKRRSFYKPLIVTVIFLAAAYYLGPGEELGNLYMIVAIIIYGIFLLRLYYRLSKCFGHGLLFAIGFIIVPFVFALILGLGKSRYQGPPSFKQERFNSRPARIIKSVIFVIVTVVEVVVLIAVLGLVSLRVRPPRLMVDAIIKDSYSETKDIIADGECITREDSMGDDYALLGDMPSGRDYFFPDHSEDESVVVMEYIIGSNLESAGGFASSNIKMMQDATKKGEALTFVLQTGGSERWFTSGINDESYGRYTVHDGKTEKVKELDDNICMSDPGELEKYLSWVKENYPADRYMLILWDHGGGVAGGYGVDDLNERSPYSERETMLVSEIVPVLKRTGIKFDLIGFDACLMQDIEIANALEPFADYYLASEESEGAYGWYYTAGFGKLAEDPGISTEEFGREMVSSYDQLNTIIKKGKPDTMATLSLVDLTMVKPAYEKLDGFFTGARDRIRNDKEDFAEIGLAASNTYAFSENLQIDLVDFIEKLYDADINGSILTEK